VIRNLVRSPLTVLPAAAGATLVAAGAVVASPLVAFGGVVALLGTAGVAATRWLAGAEAMTEKAYRQLQAESARQRVRELDQLDTQLRRDRDPRTEMHLRRLRELHGLLKEQPNVPPEVRARCDELFQLGVSALRRTLDMVRKARQVRVVGVHRRLLAEREEVIQEVAEGVRALAAAVDEVSSLQGVRGDDEAGRLAAVREELSRSLDVARRVDDRLRAMEGDVDAAATRI
jgi:hypothetical protein